MYTFTMNPQWWTLLQWTLSDEHFYNEPSVMNTFTMNPSFLTHLFIHLFRICCENFRCRSLKVPGHVKWPDLRQSLNARHSYTEWPITLKHSAVDIHNSIYKTYILKFWYRWPKVRPFSDLPIISQCENIERRIFWTKTIRITFKHRVTGRLDTLNRNIAISDPSCPRGQFRSRKVTGNFSAITFDRDKLERWKHRWCVQADNTDRLMWNMTFSDQVVTLT